MIYYIRQLLAMKNKIFTKNTMRLDIREVKTIADMPHPKSLPIFGTKIALLMAGSGKKLHEYIDMRHKQLGSIFYEQLGGSNKLVFTSDPGDMRNLFMNLEGKYPAHLLPDPWILYGKLNGNKRGLFFMDGEEWLSHRRVMNTHLLKDNSEEWLINPIRTAVEKFVKKWEKEAESGHFVPDLESEFYKFSIDVIISILLSDSTQMASKQSDFLLKTFSDSVKMIFQTTTKLYGVPVELYQRMNFKQWRDFENSVNTSLFLAKKIVTEMLREKYACKGLISKLQKENLDSDIIIRIIADFVIAAGDTTAYTSLWILYLLSQHQNVIQDIRKQSDLQIKDVVKEAMRLYPVAPFLTRILPKECILHGYVLKEGTPVIASIYTSGRDENYFSRPNDFLPHRWVRNDPRKKEFKNHVPSASLPFAMGARSCIGKKIAMLQLTELTSQIVNNFDLKCLNKDKVKPVTSQVLVPNEDIKLSVSLRK